MSFYFHSYRMVVLLLNRKFVYFYMSHNVLLDSLCFSFDIFV